MAKYRVRDYQDHSRIIFTSALQIAYELLSMAKDSGIGFWKTSLPAIYRSASVMLTNTRKY